MANILRTIYRKIRGHNINNYAFIQLAPLSLRVNEEFVASSQPRKAEIQKEIENEKQTFLEWADLNGKDLWQMDLVTGFTTVFVMFTTYEQEAHETLDDDPAGQLIKDIYEYAVLGDKGTHMDGQNFGKRCRWVKKHK